MDRNTQKTILKEAMEKKVHDKLTIPAIALTVQTISQQFKHHNQSMPSLSTLKELASELGWEYRILTDNYAKGPALVKVLEPNLDALYAELKRMTDSGYTRISYLRVSGLQCAFNYHVYADPEGIISEATWTSIFDKLGFIYESGNELLIPKPLVLPPEARQEILDVIEKLPPVERQRASTTNYQIVKAITEKELKEKLSQKLRINMNRYQWEELLKGNAGEALILSGYSLESEWVYKDDLIPEQKENGNIFKPALIKRPPQEVPSQFANGFPVYVPAAITDGITLVYLELLGPRQAVKANWAAVRSGRKINIKGQGSVIATKEDGFTTLKTTLRECGWDHWCLIHGQASCEKMIPEDDFYVLDRGEAAIPSNFYAQLAKAAPFPVLPHWVEYLWVQGRMRELITALGGTGLGAWKVFFIKEKWEEIVSKGLEQGKIKIRRS